MTRYTLIALASVALLSASCDKKDEGAHPSADNTKVNERDKGKTVTPIDQGNSQPDLDTTQKIRQALTSNDTLSTDAKNVKVITNGGVITLRGPVKSDAEKTTIEGIAKQNAGSNRVDSQLEVAPK